MVEIFILHVHNWVVGCRVEFDIEYFLRDLQVLELGAKPLWDSTQAVSVLSKSRLRVRFDMVGSSELRGKEHAADIGSRFNLPWMWAGGLV